MEIINIVSSAISLLLGGGIAWIFSIKYTRRQAEADAMQHFQIVYKEMINDLKEDRENIREELTKLKEQQREDSAKLKELEQNQQKNTNIIKQLTRMACVKAPVCSECVLIDISQL